MLLLKNKLNMNNNKPTNTLINILAYIFFIYLFINISNFNENKNYRNFFSHTKNQLLMLIILIIIAFINKHITILAFILFVIQYKIAYK